jgi:hypothetical protein
MAGSDVEAKITQGEALENAVKKAKKEKKIIPE